VAELFDFAKAIALPQDEETQNGLPADQKQRDLALDITRSWIVEAPAGSGKTGLLIQRYLKLLTDEYVTEPEQVLAITFTQKATEEMRERIVSQLEAAREADGSKSHFDRVTRSLAQAVLERDAALGWKLLRHPDRLNVRTIDSICAEIARTLPVLSGAGGVAAPVPDAWPLYHEAARRTLDQLGGDDEALSEALRLVLLHRDGSLGEVERLIAEMLQWRDQWGSLIPLHQRELDDAYLEQAVRPRLERALEQQACFALRQLDTVFPRHLLHELATLAGELAVHDGYSGGASPIAVCAGHFAPPEAGAEDLPRWRALIHLLLTKGGEWRSSFGRHLLRFLLSREEAARLVAIVDALRGRDDLLQAIQRVRHLPPVKYPEEQWRVAKALFRVLSRALAELQIIFADRGECDFAELGLLARAALAHDDGVDALEMAHGMRFRHMLVDEMQDTSTSQYELIELLTRGWHGGGQTVFLVGDPKQSIYLFRQARVERFIETMQTLRIGEMPLGLVRLTANFRSQSRLVDAFNEDFALLFPANISAEHAEEAPFVGATAVRGPSRDGARNVVWHAEPLSPGLQGEELKAERRRRSDMEAVAVRSIIHEWRERPLPPGRTKPWQIAVLVQNRSHLSRIVRALKEDTDPGPIPFRAVDIEALGDQQEILDLFALTRSLLHPADRVAWLGVLRAPWCGLGLADLHLLAGGDDPKWARRSMEGVIAERGHELSEENCSRLMRLWDVLQAAMRQRSRLTLAQWVERTWRSLGGDAYLTETQMANARRYFELLDALEEESAFVDTRVLQQRLAKLYAEPATNEDAVDLMTIHKAKGLEWDVVIVPGLEKMPRSDATRLLTWSEVRSEDDGCHVLLAPIHGKGEDSHELTKWLHRMQSAREAAERKRLFYVACTRAQEELHLFAAPKTSSVTGAAQLERNSLLKAAWPAAQRHFASSSSAEVVTMERADLRDQDRVIALAAQEDESYPVLERLPLSFNPRDRFQAAVVAAGRELDPREQTAAFTRPEGSLEVRALGTVVHAFMELLARRISDGTKPEELTQEVGGWERRIAALLRAEGLPAATVARMQPVVTSALENTLRDADGLWILSAQEEASSEYGLTVWEAGARSVRLDRTFRAGAEPRATGRECLWIIDYKTAAHGSHGVEQFLERERKKYSPQMEAYSRVMQTSSAGAEIRLGLYYPLVPRLVWWKPGS
jgi:ATP-dependent helicase/nuclease subunit A